MSKYTLKVLALDPAGKPLTKHRIELWDHDSNKDDFMGEDLTDAEGRCVFRFDEQRFGDNNGKPDVYFKVFKDEELLCSTRSATVFNLKFTNASITLRVGTEVSLENVRKADQIPFQTKDLRKQPGNFSGNAAVFVTNKLNLALSVEVNRLLNDLDPKILSAVKDIRLDYTAWLEKNLGEVIQGAILPVLLQDCELKKLLEERNLTETLVQNNRSVRELLHADLPVRKNPLFQEEARILYTSELVAAFDLNADIAERLLEKSSNWARATGEQWDELVKEQVLSKAEKETLQRGFVLSRFTGGNATLAARLHQKLPKLQDMVRWDADDWKEMIKDADGDTPGGETTEEYADNLMRLAQRSFPSAFFLERKVQRSLSKDALLSELKKLQPTGGKKENKSPISLSESPILQGVANTYRHLGVEKLLSDPDTSAAAKMETLAAKQGYLKKFTDNNPGFDLRTADFFAKDESGQRKHSMTGIPEEEQAAVRNQMMAFQRVGRLGSTYEVQDALLKAGFDSSHHIVQGNSSQLGDALGGTLSAGQIRAIYAAALQQYQQMIQATLAFQSINSTNYFGLQVLDYPEELKNHLQNIDGYSAMFGDQNYCECDHCKSIFGPAAYFVDLMRFVDQQVNLVPQNSNFPLDIATKRDLHPISLKKRRPDLWNLELSCENTNRPIPYLWLINKIKITYLCQVMGITWDNTKSFEYNAELLWAELARLPMGVTGTGGSWKNGFRVAFNRPFEESQILLEALSVPYLDILQALDVNQAERQAAAYLGLSEEEWGILTTEDKNFEDLAYQRFTFPAEDENADIKRWKVKVFQRATALNREQVETLL
ncbi:MAG: hypothetical protein JNJ57_17525, partial [Saprospiraceae bacterium]|nr:hypothetical protein [Saprospiraceae bacterium]